MSELQTIQIRLDKLLEMRWQANPKLHATDLIAESIRAHGFNDPPEIDQAHNLLVVGHGRAELLDTMFKADPTQEIKNIGRDTDGMWLVPVIPLEFDTLNNAYLYAIRHNRSTPRASVTTTGTERN